MILKIACIIALLVSLTSGLINTSESYTHSATLKSEKVRLYWRFNDTHITFEVHAETTGWIGIGFSPNGAMTGADIYIGWVKNGQATVTDRHGLSNSFPPLDPKQDIDVLGGSECDGWTMLKFSRQLAACEAEFDREITQHTQRLIWAWGETDPAGDDVQPWDYHGPQRGVKSMYFLQSDKAPSGLPEGPEYKTFDILVDNFEIPQEDTYYNCKIFKLPKLLKKHHIVKFEPVIQKGNEPNVHHINVRKCRDDVKNSAELEDDAWCYSGEERVKSCTNFFVGWAVGGETRIFPEVAGLSIGGKDDMNYVMLETHYDNPRRQSGIIDNSGIRFTYTDKLRQHDVGVIKIGTAVPGAELLIPPGSEHFLNTGHCSAECLENRLEDAGVNNITVFSIFLHTHLAGKSLRLRRIRKDGFELPYPAEDLHYDFNYQESRFIDPPIVLNGGERLQLECVYNTEGRVNVTEGGLGTYNEMCLSYIAYYPKIDLWSCVSTVPKQRSFSYFGIDPTSIQRDPTKIGFSLDSFTARAAGEKSERMSADKFLNQLEWSPQKIKQFEIFYNSLEQVQYCIPDDIRKTTFARFNVTKIKQPYIKPQKTCRVTQHLLSQKIPSQGCSKFRTVSPVRVEANRPGATLDGTDTTISRPSATTKRLNAATDRPDVTTNRTSGTAVNMIMKSFTTKSSESEAASPKLRIGVSIAVSTFLLTAAAIIALKAKG